MSSVKDTVERLLRDVGLDPSLASHLSLSQPANSPVLPSSFAFGHLAQATIASSALSAANLYRLRGGELQSVSVDERHAALEFASEHWTLLDGKLPGAIWDPIAGPYPTVDGYVRVHTNFPHHRIGIIRLLNCPDTREGVAEALKSWKAEDFETAAAKAGLCVTALRSFEEWDAHPHGQALKGVPAVQVIKVGDAPKRAPPKETPSSPLEDVRILDLTRVIAGPTGGRALAAHGADVLLITSPNLPAIEPLDIDTSRGKRTTQLDLTQNSDRETLKSLARDADVFLQAYRPRGLEEKGFGVQDVVSLRPGIVYASLRAYGWDGPWQDRRGFDSLTQTAAGINLAEAEAFNSTLQPGEESKKMPLKALPAQGLDHAAGQLLALGISAALARTYTEGGSYEVRVSLAATANLLRSLPRIPAEKAFGPKATALQLPGRDPRPAEIENLTITLPIKSSKPKENGKEDSNSNLKAIRHAAVLEKTPVRTGWAPRGLNADEPKWLARSAAY